jgi:hypothetical protein
MDKYIIDPNPFTVYHKISQLITSIHSSSIGHFHHRPNLERQCQIAIKKHHRNYYQIESQTSPQKKRDLGRSRRGFHLGGIDGETNNNDGEEADLLRLDAEEGDPTEEEADPNEEEADLTEEEADRPESTPHVSTEPGRRSS